MSGDQAHLARRARSFGGGAEVCDRARPGYPAALFGHIAGELSGPRVLEVGAGTGKATAGLLAQRLQVTCLEPDAQPAAVLAARTADAPQLRIDQAWHWTAAEAAADHTPTGCHQAHRLP